jgi:isopropylmalate/homocitrate/citramalate synthase
MQSCSPFVQNIISKSAKHRELYNKISPILFDVSLRDGIQGANPANWPHAKKRTTFSSIYTQYKPQILEIGSLCSYKLLPIMSDTRELYDYVVKEIERNDDHITQTYVLIPSIKKLQTAIQYGMTHFSFITSASPAFQLKNTNRTLEQVKREFSQLCDIDLYQLCLLLNGQLPLENFTKKLYISCINECPISGKIDNDFIIKELLHYHYAYSFDELCLSDTCGTLLYQDFEYIIETIHFFGIPLSKVSLHLHVSNIENLEHILRYCFRKGIRKFDISAIETGGCSITMNKDRLLANMTYEQFYHILNKHIDAVVEYNNLETN